MAARDPRDAVLAVVARYVMLSERRCSAQALAVQQLARSPNDRHVAEGMLHEMRRTLEMARLHEAFLRTLDEPEDR